MIETFLATYGVHLAWGALSLGGVALGHYWANLKAKAVNLEQDVALDFTKVKAFFEVAGMDANAFTSRVVTAVKADLAAEKAKAAAELEAAAAAEAKFKVAVQAEARRLQSAGTGILKM